MESAIYLKHAAEICGKQGPTGEFAEVTEGQVMDYGDNVLFAGSPDSCVRFAKKYRMPTRLVPTKWVRRAEKVGAADYTWEMC